MKHLSETIVILGILLLAGMVALEGYKLYEQAGRIIGLVVCVSFALGGLAIAAIRVRVLLGELVALEASRLNKMK